MSAQLPPIEARVSAQEKMQIILHARIEELAQDMTESFKQQVAYQIYFEQKVDAHFDKVDARFSEVDARFDKIEAEIADIKANMATKEDVAVSEKRVLDAFQQLLTMIDQRLPRS